MDTLVPDVFKLLHGCLDPNEQSINFILVQSAVQIHRVIQTFERTYDHSHFRIGALKLLTKITVHLILSLNQITFSILSELLQKGSHNCPYHAPQRLRRSLDPNHIQQLLHHLLGLQHRPERLPPKPSAAQIAAARALHDQAEQHLEGALADAGAGVADEGAEAGVLDLGQVGNNLRRP